MVVQRVMIMIGELRFRAAIRGNLKALDLGLTNPHLIDIGGRASRKASIGVSGEQNSARVFTVHGVAIGCINPYFRLSFPSLRIRVYETDKVLAWVCTMGKELGQVDRLRKHYLISKMQRD